MLPSRKIPFANITDYKSNDEWSEKNMTKRVYSFSIDEGLIDEIPFENRSQYVQLALINLKLSRKK